MDSRKLAHACRTTQATCALTRHSKVTSAARCVNWLLPQAWTRLPSEMFEAYKDRKEAGQYLGRELRKRLPRLLQEHQQQQHATTTAQHGSAQPIQEPAGDLAKHGSELEPTLSDVIVLGLVRGGMPVADHVARALQCSCDAFVVRKIGAPLQPEFGIGAVAEGGHVIINEAAMKAVGATQQQLQHILDRETQELNRRLQVYRDGRPHLPVTGKTVVLVDDGLATGVTAHAACDAMRAAGAALVVLAVPVGSARTVAELQQQHVADAVVCLRTPQRFRAVGAHYLDFSQTSDEEVVAILQRYPHPPEARQLSPTGTAGSIGAAVQRADASTAAAAGQDTAAGGSGTQPTAGALEAGALEAAAAAAAAAADTCLPGNRKDTKPAVLPAGLPGDALTDTSARKDQANHTDTAAATAVTVPADAAAVSAAAAAAAGSAAVRASALAAVLGLPAAAQLARSRTAHEAASHAAPAAAAAAEAAAFRGLQPVQEEEVVIPDSETGVQLHGSLTVPPGAVGLVVFAHGSGSSRHSPRNRQVASTLHRAGLATLLFDLLAPEEAQQRQHVFNITLLANRLQLAVEWLEAQGATTAGRCPPDFPLGFFGASTGGGAALWAAAYLGPRVSAVVVRGGRPDLAAAKLPAVTAPTLLIVGGEDTHVLELNDVALQMMGGSDSSQMVVVPGAGHLFEGPGQLEQVAELAVQWFRSHMGAGGDGTE